MVGGGAYMVGKHAQRNKPAGGGPGGPPEPARGAADAGTRQPRRAAPAPAAAPAGGDLVSKLTELKGLMDAGVLTADEFEAAKQKLLSQ